MAANLPELMDRQAELTDLRWAGVHMMVEHARGAYPFACSCAPCRAVTHWVGPLDAKAIPSPLVEPMTPEDENARLSGLLELVAVRLGVGEHWGSGLEEEAILKALNELNALAGPGARKHLAKVLELTREAHACMMLGSAPKAKESMGEACVLMLAILKGRA
jgi:hypothetical protein